MVVGIALAIFLALGIGYSLVVPPFETPDELFHYGFAHYVATEGGLPVQDPDATGPWAQEGSQAPLYYLLTGWLTRGIDQSDFPASAVRNPRANIGDPLYPGNKNFMLYSGIHQPLTGSVLALHIGRWISLTLGMITLLCLYGTARLATPPYHDAPRHFALTTTALSFAAFVPQFIFISASFSNDSMIIAAAALVVFWLARLLARPTDQNIAWWEWVVLGLLLGVAALSKLQGLGLFALAAVAGLIIMWQRRDWWLPVRVFLLVALPALAVSGWWYWRNFTLYGDWLGISHLLEINGQRTTNLSIGGFIDEFRGLRYSFWGLFGWFNILLPIWFYWIMDVVTVLGLAAVVIVYLMSLNQGKFDIGRRADRRVRLMLLAWIAISVVLMAYWVVQATGSQGRLLMPALTAFGTLVALGLTAWMELLPPRVVNGVWGGLLAIMILMSVTSLTGRLPRAYAQPDPIAALPEEITPVDVTYGDADRIILDAIDVDTTRIGLGEQLPVTLYLHSDAPVTENYQLFLQLVDVHGQPIANITTHPGWGRNPTSIWAPGALYEDPYLLPVEGPVVHGSPMLANLYVGFVDPTSVEGNLRPATARDADGEEITPFLTQVVVEPWSQPTAEEAGLTPQTIVFGGRVGLTGSGYTPTLPTGAGNLPVTLLWHAETPLTREYVAYVHLLNATGTRVAGFDQPPAGGRLPTSYWTPGDAILTDFPLELPADLPPGTYTLWVGIYEEGSGGEAWLPVTHDGGLPADGGRVRIGDVIIGD